MLPILLIRSQVMEAAANTRYYKETPKDRELPTANSPLNSVPQKTPEAGFSSAHLLPPTDQPWARLSYSRFRVSDPRVPSAQPGDHHQSVSQQRADVRISGSQRRDQRVSVSQQRIDARVSNSQLNVLRISGSQRQQQSSEPRFPFSRSLINCSSDPARLSFAPAETDGAMLPIVHEAQQDFHPFLKKEELALKMDEQQFTQSMRTPVLHPYVRSILMRSESFREEEVQLPSAKDSGSPAAAAEPFVTADPQLSQRSRSSCSSSYGFSLHYSKLGDGLARIANEVFTLKLRF
jgi:hypothetical protein